MTINKKVVWSGPFKNVVANAVQAGNVIYLEMPPFFGHPAC